MRELLRRILTGSTTSSRRLAVAIGKRRSSPYQRVRPGEVRNWRFTTTWRGLDPAEVAAFLSRVADDIGGLQAELARSRAETERIKGVLRRHWAEQARPARYLAAHR